jgi:Divergent InlB B-repeat domain
VTSLKKAQHTRLRALRGVSVVGLALLFGLSGSLAATGAPSTVPLKVIISGQGTVVGTPHVSCAKSCTARLVRGTVVRLTARPAKGWRLNRWAGACTGRLGCQLTLRAPRTVHAVFAGSQPTSPPPSASPELWVDVNGGACTRQPSGGSYADVQACGSFQAAYTAARCGDTVGVRPGTYGSQSISVGGKACTPSTQVRFTGAAGTTCADNTATTMRSFSIAVGYVRLHCLSANPPGGSSCSEIRGRLGHADAAWNTLDHVRVRCAFLNADHLHVGFTTFGPVNICQTGQEDMIVFAANADAINDVIFDHVTFATVDAPPDVECGAGKHVDSIQGYGVSNLVISNSVFYGCPGQCIILRPLNGGTPGPIRIENTIFNQPQDPGQAVNIGSSGSSNGDRCNGPIVVQNNTFVNDAAFHGGCWNNPTVIVRNNIMTDSSCNFGGANVTYTSNVFYGSRSCGANARRCRPAYIRNTSSVTALGDFHLAAGDTCAKGAASQSAGSYARRDIDGQFRPRGAAVDAGADEIG